MNAHKILEKAAQHMKDRAATYDKPEGERSMGATVEAFKAITGHELTEEQGWLFMALLKAVRSQQGGYRADSYEDGAAYFALAGEAAAGARVDATGQRGGDMSHYECALDATRLIVHVALNQHGIAVYANDKDEPARTSAPTGWYQRQENGLYRLIEWDAQKADKAMQKASEIAKDIVDDAAFKLKNGIPIQNTEGANSITIGWQDGIDRAAIKQESDK